MQPVRVPDDFPRESHAASLAGSQPKLAARLVHCTYVAGLSPEELLERYEACEDLAQQLAVYCTRKAAENPSWSRDFNLSRAHRGVARKVKKGLWDISEAERRWVMTRVREILDW